MRAAHLPALVGAAEKAISEHPRSEMSDNYPLPPDEEDWRWEREAEDLRHQALDRVRDAANKWTSGIAVLFALVSVSGFVGADALKEVPEGMTRSIVVGGVAVAATLAAIGAVLGSLAAHGTPRRVATLDGATLRASTLQRADNAAGLLLWSRVAVIAALASVAISGTLVLSAGGSQGVNLVITDDRGVTHCGRAQAGANSVATVGGYLLHTAKGPVVVVDRC
jgi:hypothetical protein